MISFGCNICGAKNRVETLPTEASTCSCGSNVRVRAVIHMLSLELFGQSIPLVEFPVIKGIRGLGMTDQPGYAAILAKKFDYTNTFYDREPRLDFTEDHPQLAGRYDFILSSDVLEHIAPPVARPLEVVHSLLRPEGFLVLTVLCNPEDQMREHFPHLHDYRIVQLGDSMVLVNRRADGGLEVTDNLIFHGGSGATLEMREFGISALQGSLRAAGFCELEFLTDDVPEIGILFDKDVSQPLIARKAPAVSSRIVRSQLTDQLRQLQLQNRSASRSWWMRLGRRLGLGPRLD